jgi:hypothetical protein
MGRTFRCSIAGAGTGFLVGFVAVSIAAGGHLSSPDIPAIILFVGVFLAGSGAIAGAIIGGVADLREFFTMKDQTPREPQDRDKSRGGSG